MSTYTKAAREAVKEREKLLSERARIDRRLLRLQQTIATLLRLEGSDSPDSISNKGIADAIRDLMGFRFKKGFNDAIGVADLRHHLESIGYDFSRYQNPNASLSGTLERLTRAGELKKVRITRPDGARLTGYVVDEGLKYEGEPKKEKKK